jgi:heavy metal sensor kinase
LNLLLITLLIGVPLIVIVAGCGGYFLAARALTPIAEMTQMAHDISAQDLSARLNLPKTDDEVGRLAVTLDSMLDRLDRAFRRERQFTADASHELRTPLSALQMIIDSTLTQPRTTAEYVQALTDLRHEAELMKSLTEGLLDLAHSDAADPLIAMEPIQIAVLLNDVVESFQPMAEEKGLVLHNYVVDGKTTVLGDSDALIRLFVNLLDNAIKYTVRGSITVCAQRNVDHSYVIKIQDTGPGIPAEHLPHLFDRFYRVDKARSQHGIGLGLAIARSITYAHGGEITVESVVGQGTNFMVYLRVAAHGALTEQ